MLSLGSGENGLRQAWARERLTSDEIGLRRVWAPANLGLDEIGLGRAFKFIVCLMLPEMLPNIDVSSTPQTFFFVLFNFLLCVKLYLFTAIYKK